MNTENKENRNRDKVNAGKKATNAGSGAFNQGVEQEPDYDEGTKVSDEEKRTGHTPSPGKEKKNSFGVKKPKNGVRNSDK